MAAFWFSKIITFTSKKEMFLSLFQLFKVLLFKGFHYLSFLKIFTQQAVMPIHVKNGLHPPSYGI